MPVDRVSEPALVAGVELNAHLNAGTFGAIDLRGAVVSTDTTPVHDVNGEVLFHRVPVMRDGRSVAAVDVAVHPALGDPLLAVTPGLDWRPDALVGEARERARRLGLPVERATQARLVAYSYPKLAVQFLARGRELAMLEVGTFVPVPRRERRGEYREPLQPSNFERWSLLDEMPAGLARLRSRAFTARMRAVRSLGRRLDPLIIRPEGWIDRLKFQFLETRELAYSLRAGDHTPCYELRGQETNVWCVGASVQMLLDFYRYPYTQVRLAQELGLGTLANPNGLPYANVGQVVTAIEALTTNGLDATMVTNPVLDVFRNEIRANRPVISFVPGHSRTVAGFTTSFIAPLHQQPYTGLLVYDPWPPNSGVITRWENAATQVYQYAYTARVRTI